MSTTRPPLIPGTPRHGTAVEEGATCWYEGYRVGRRGEGRFTCPYATGTVESWSWLGGHIEGKERRRKDTRQA